MLHKLILALLACLLLAFPAMAECEEDRLAEMDILSQFDQRLAGRAYTYRSNPFSRNGCQPASIANALCAALGDAALDTPGLLKEVMHLLAPQNRPQERKIHTARLSYLTEGIRDERYPILNSLLSTRDRAEAALSVRETDKLLEQVRSMGDQRFLITGKISLRSNWSWLVELTDQLLQAGYGGATLTIASLGAGTSGTSGPFRSLTDGGHYITAHLQVQEFCTTGTLYLLDSNPRALSGETFGDGGDFALMYEFCKPHKKTVFTRFNQTYTVSRISPTVLKISLVPKELQALEEGRAGAQEDPSGYARFVRRRATQLTPLQFFGTGVFLLTSP